MTILADIIPDQDTREFLRIIDQECGHDAALAFLEDFLRGVWIYAGESQLLLEVARRATREAAARAESKVSTRFEGWRQEAML